MKRKLPSEDDRSDFWPQCWDGPVRMECMMYGTLSDASTMVNQLGWWKVNEGQLPLLSYLVRVVFAVPVASSKSEIVFSVASSTVTPKRSTLDPLTMESIATKKCNIRTLREMGLRNRVSYFGFCSAAGMRHLLF